MVFAGNWFTCKDGVSRPTIEAEVATSAGHFVAERFLIDTGADFTALDATLVKRIGITETDENSSRAVSGVGGLARVVAVSTSLRLQDRQGGFATFRGRFAGFVDEGATDLSVLGRDVLDHFDLIVARGHGEVLLLLPRHRFRVEPEG